MKLGHCGEGHIDRKQRLLKDEYNLLDVQKATSIKTKKNYIPLLLSFKKKEPQRFIEIQGERATN